MCFFVWHEIQNHQESLSKIHKLRDQLKSGNEKLRDLKKGVKEAQDKLKVRSDPYGVLAIW